MEDKGGRRSAYGKWNQLSVSRLATTEGKAGGDSTPYVHHDNIAPSGYVSSEWFALVHQPISLQHAKGIPDAAQALDDE
eukprot:3188188-Karenia_brevis.AAC.1